MNLDQLNSTIDDLLDTIESNSNTLEILQKKVAYYCYLREEQLLKINKGGIKMNIDKFLNILLSNDFVKFEDKDYIFKKDNISVEIWGNSKNEFYGDIVIRDLNNCEQKKVFDNYDDDEYELLIEHLKYVGAIK